MEKIINVFNIKENMYSIDEQGNIKNIIRGKYLSKIYTAGYPSVALQTNDNQRKTFYIHRIIGAMFVEKDNDEYNVIHHKDFNKLNPSPDNLMWCNKDINNKLGDGPFVKIPFTIVDKGWGYGEQTYGENNGMHRLTEDQVKHICQELEKGATHRQCAINAGLEGTENDRLIVTSIKNKKRWKYISKNYNI